MTQSNHDLFKDASGRWKCRICDWTWRSKPNTECPGVVRYDWGNKPDCLKTLVELHKRNLKPKQEDNPSGCIYSMAGTCWVWLYEEKDCVLYDPDLPPIYAWDNREELKTTGELKKINLAPNPEIKPRGVAWVWDKEAEWGVWIPLYHTEDCRWQPKDNYITKSTLKQAYLLSEGWIKKLVQPDKKVENPHGYTAAPIQLFSRHRVENFLADNAEKYAEWLDKREKYLAIFEANRDKIQAGRDEAQERRKQIKEQTAKCLKCASGCSTPQGFLCAIYPMGVNYIPCPDWQPRRI